MYYMQQLQLCNNACHHISQFTVVNIYLPLRWKNICPSLENKLAFYLSYLTSFQINPFFPSFVLYRIEPAMYYTIPKSRE